MILKDLAGKVGMNYLTLYSRYVINKWPLEKALSEKSKTSHMLYYQGSLYSFRGLCKLLGVPFPRWNWYFSTGKTPKEAFERCLEGRRPKEC